MLWSPASGPPPASARSERTRTMSAARPLASPETLAKSVSMRAISWQGKTIGILLGFSWDVSPQKWEIYEYVCAFSAKWWIFQIWSSKSGIEHPISSSNLLGFSIRFQHQNAESSSSGNSPTNMGSEKSDMGISWNVIGKLFMALQLSNIGFQSDFTTNLWRSTLWCHLTWLGNLVKHMVKMCLW